MKALVTGGNSKLGQIIVDVLQSSGFEVLAHYNSNKIEGGIFGDFSTVPGTRDFIDRIPNDVDFLINSAGEFPEPVQSILTESDDDFHRILNVSAIAPLMLIKAFGSRMKANGFGGILGILDSSVEKPFLLRPSHTLAKKMHQNVLELAKAELSPEVIVDDLVLDKVISNPGETGEFIGAENFRLELDDYLQSKFSTLFDLVG